MISSDDQGALINEMGLLFHSYRDTVKPLLALVEATYEKFPIPIYNEMRAFTDHLSRCYNDDGALKNKEEVREQFNKASHHIKRATYDLYKLLIISGKEELESFERKTQMLDLRTVDSNGSFSSAFSEGRSKAIALTRQAKLAEARNEIDAAYTYYDEAYGVYLDLHDLIKENTPGIYHAKAKWYFRYFISFITFIVGAIISPYIETLWMAFLSLFQ